MIYIGLAVAIVAFTLLGWALFRFLRWALFRSVREEALSRASSMSEQAESAAQVPTPYPDSEILESTEQLYIVRTDTRVSVQTNNSGDVFYLPRGTLIIRVHHRYIYVDNSQDRSQEVPQVVMAQGLQRRAILAVPTGELLGYLASLLPTVPVDPVADDEILSAFSGTPDAHSELLRTLQSLRANIRRRRTPSTEQPAPAPEGPSQIDRLLKEDDLV